MKPSLVRALIEREFEAAVSGTDHTPVLLWGPPGVGKSAIVASVAHAHQVPLVDIRLAQMEPTDLRGIPFREGDGVTWAVPRMLPDAVRHGPRGILFLDELTSAVPTVTAAAYQLILDRRLGEYRVPAGWAIVAAGNRHGDRGVTYQMPAPLANRFAHYDVDADLDDWVQWADEMHIDPRIVAFLRFRPDLLFAFDAARTAAAFPSPRTWVFAARALAKFSDHPELLAEALAGCVGASAALALRAFMQHIAALPDPAVVLADDSIAIPEPVELQYALATSLARHIARLVGPAQSLAIDRALSIARRFKAREIGTMLVTDLARVSRAPLVGRPAFAQWATEVGELLAR